MSEPILFANEPLCNCHEPAMPATLCATHNAAIAARIAYRARLAREATAAQTPA